MRDITKPHDGYGEQTYRNNFTKDFDFKEFNCLLIDRCFGRDLALIFDPSYISKRGKSMPGRLPNDQRGVFSMADIITRYSNELLPDKRISTYEKTDYRKKQPRNRTTLSIW